MGSEDEFGRALRTSRLDRGFSLFTFAEKLGIKPADLSRIEDGFSAPGEELLGDLEGCGLTVESIERLRSLAKTKSQRPSLSRGEAVSRMPVLFRKNSSAGVSEEDFDGLIDLISS